MRLENILWCVLALAMLAACGNKKADAGSEENETVVTEQTVEAAARRDVDSTDARTPAQKADNYAESVSAGKVTVPNDGRPVLLDFTATWCPPCRMMKPIFQELEDTYDDMMNFVAVDIDQNPELASQYAIQTVPTFIFLDKKGRIVKRVEGAVEQEVLENQIGKMITM